jgi:hypothetical protein
MSNYVHYKVNMCTYVSEFYEPVTLSSCQVSGEIWVTRLTLKKKSGLL